MKTAALRFNVDKKQFEKELFENDDVTDNHVISLTANRCVFNILQRNVDGALTSRDFDNNLYRIIYCTVLWRAHWVGQNTDGECTRKYTVVLYTKISIK